jgi:hypothetical protein
MMHRPLALIPLLLATPALAQFSLEPKAPTPLPDPPFLAHYLLESTSLPCALVIAAGVISYLIFQSTKPRRARQLAGLFLALAAALFTTGALVQTPREKAIEVTKQLVHSVAAGDTHAVDAALASTAALYSDTQLSGQPKHVILEKVGIYFAPSGQYALEGHAILEIQAFIANPELAQVQLKVRTTSKGVPILSWWRCDLTPTPSGSWEVSGIRYLSSTIPFSSELSQGSR